MIGFLWWVVGALTVAPFAYLLGRRHGPVRERTEVLVQYVPVLPDGRPFRDTAVKQSDGPPLPRVLAAFDPGDINVRSVT